MEYETEFDSRRWKRRCLYCFSLNSYPDRSFMMGSGSIMRKYCYYCGKKWKSFDKPPDGVVVVNVGKRVHREEKMEWNVGWCIDGVSVKLLTKNEDKRGWLLEVWRSDDVDIPVMPAMSYISCTKPDTVRGPHEHVEQTDIFVFLTGEWAVRLWDDRVGSKTYGVERTILVSKPTTVVVPPGVIHAYANIGQDDGLVINLPDKLYCGKLKKQTPDELRHEGNPRYSVDGMIRKVEKKWFW